MAWLGLLWLGEEFAVGRGSAWPGTVRCGAVRLGVVWSGEVRSKNAYLGYRELECL